MNIERELRDDKRRAVDGIVWSGRNADLPCVGALDDAQRVELGESAVHHSATANRGQIATQ